jgi:hypothetical protein
MVDIILYSMSQAVLFGPPVAGIELVLLRVSPKLSRPVVVCPGQELATRANVARRLPTTISFWELT